MNYLEQFSEQFISYLPHLIGAIVLFIVGWFLINRLKNLWDRFFEHTSMDASLKPFLSSLLLFSLRIILAIIALNLFTSNAVGATLITLLGTVGLAVGLAFQGTLSNFAGGVLILTLKPFEVGNYITANGHSGTVELIGIFNTTLVTPDNVTISIPNGTLSNTDVINYSKKPTRRVDLEFGVGYECNINKVKTILLEIISDHPDIQKYPDPFVKLSSHGDSALVFTVRVWTDSSKYWDVHFDLLETVKNRFDKEGISIPYPQMDLHVMKDL